MGDVSLDDILVTPLKRIPTVGGDVLHALKKTDAGFDGFGDVRQSMLETSNVNVTEELVNMIEAQRVYEMNSKVISAVDKMMGFVNQQL